MIQIQMAMQMHEVEQRMRERQMLVMMMSNTYNQQQEEEDRMIRRVMEESKAQADPNSPDVDNMTYEQLLALEEKSG